MASKIGASPCVGSCACVWGVIWLACWPDIWSNVHLSADADTSRALADTVTYLHTHRTRADPHLYTFRCELRYVQISAGIRADTNWDTCRYGLWDTCRYEQKRYKQYMSRYGQKYVSEYIHEYILRIGVRFNVH